MPEIRKTLKSFPWKSKLFPELFQRSPLIQWQ